MGLTTRKVHDTLMVVDETQLERVVIRMTAEVNWVPVKTAAAMLGVSRQRVCDLCRRQKLQSRRLDGTMLVSVGSVRDRFLLQRGRSVREELG